MDLQPSEDQVTIRKAVAELAARFDDRYRQCKDEAHEFPTAFYPCVRRGWWPGITTPEAAGGSGLGIAEACILLEQVSASSGG